MSPSRYYQCPRTLIEKEIKGTKARAKIQVVCPYCNKEGQKINMYRWHFDNCKQKTEMGL